jgi:hypothetical protein
MMVLLSLMGGRQLEKALLTHTLGAGYEQLEVRLCMCVYYHVRVCAACMAQRVWARACAPVSASRLRQPSVVSEADAHAPPRHARPHTGPHQASLLAGDEGPDRSAAVLESFRLLNAALRYDQAAAAQFNAWTAVEHVRERVAPLHQALLAPPQRLAVLLLYIMPQDMDLQQQVRCGVVSCVCVCVYCSCAVRAGDGAAAGWLKQLDTDVCVELFQPPSSSAIPRPDGTRTVHTQKRPLAAAATSCTDPCLRTRAHTHTRTHICLVAHTHMPRGWRPHHTQQVIELLGTLAARLPDLVSLLQPNFDDAAALLIRQGFAQVCGCTGRSSAGCAGMGVRGAHRRRHVGACVLCPHSRHAHPDKRPGHTRRSG